MKASGRSINIRVLVLFAGLTAATYFINGKAAIWRLFTPPGDAIAAASLSQVIRAVNGRSTLIIDVRAPRRFRFGHILNAVNIPMDRLKTELTHFTNSPNLILYGQNQSLDIPGMQAALVPTSLGDRSALYEGGWDEWSELGLPAAESGPPPTAEATPPKKLDDEARRRPQKADQKTHIAQETGLLQPMLADRALQEPLRNVQEAPNPSRQLDSRTNGVASQQLFQ